MYQNNQLVLYRGDSMKIDSFEYRKTYSQSLLGRGIYLTNKLKNS